MDERKELILNTIIKEHIKTGAPVGSSILVEKYKLNVSPATVRNDMAFLEDEGYIIQPHTSAGRVPTEKAYLEHINKIKNNKLSSGEKTNLDDLLSGLEETNFKEAAKFLSQTTNSAIIWAFHRHNVYYTGLSNLFQQPEFSQISLIHDISQVIDRIDEIVDNMFNDTPDGINTLVGSKNPFGQICSTVSAKYRSGDKTGLLAILGPMRMDYEKNLALVGHIYNKINNT